MNKNNEMPPALPLLTDDTALKTTVRRYIDGLKEAEE